MTNPRHAAPTAHRVWITHALPALSLATVLAVSGCSVPGLPGPTGAPAPAVEQAAAVTPAPEAEPTPPPAPAPAPAPVPEPVPVKVIPNDLADGSTSHSLGAAGNHLIVDYWTTENTATWSAESSPIIQLSAKVVGSADDRIIKITRFNARVDALNAVLANDTGDFAIGDPNSYSSAVVVPGHPGADSTRIVFTFDLLTETGPFTGVFTRQTVMDSLTIGYSAPATPVPSPTSAPQ
ncbi:hypothetical protein [Pseudarthrobacter sp. NamB4]|uniref:hypothetical protein n=1 Tax=Pseudarthrobacter sp. NamB4 TaxID=2576837 RepID=UPI0010FCFD1D|nr:hypothetical protein [Pseudarthrobacter sp. NamB4]TLM74511.1 hypothetical protein FDW81_04615 [Pseudarthrobacter sp. NamB4]